MYVHSRCFFRYVSSNDAGVMAASSAVGQCVSSLREQELNYQPIGRLQECVSEMESIRRRHEHEMHTASENVMYYLFLGLWMELLFSNAYFVL